ncbi:PAS domain S-box-containing protein [Archangium gephyra]|uniref:histidine kinase n=1 Tax=Archangium gephyra TaxID=48 RepID=A0AAC8TI14_9BACT|nr:ATP-binding protein [Archangium gephyra]AKJ06718.1 sensory box histidine kinase [Archangium gephyra]REG31978.1 PAS domain S-box-containing protein [Archangium gephyra]
MSKNEGLGAEQQRLELGTFIRDNRARLLQEWERAVRRLPYARELSRPRLLDHLPDLLDRIAQVVETVRTGGGDESLEGLPEVHALERLDSGFDLDDVAGEYALLRGCILQLYAEHVEEAGAASLAVAMQEVVRFNRTFDEAVAAAVSRYARARERTLVALDRISEASLGTEDADTFLPKLLRVILETTEAVDSVTLLLREGDVLRVHASVGLEELVASGFSLKVGEGFSGTIAAERCPREVRSAATDPLVRSEAVRSRGTRALYGVPLLYAGEVIGVAHMGSRTTFEFSNEDKLLFRAMVSRVTALIVQAQLAAREREVERQQAETLALLDSLLAATPACLALLDTELRYVRVNEALAAANGAPVEAHVGRTPSEVVPDRASLVEPLLRRVLETGEALRAQEFSAVTATDPGVLHHWLGDYFPVRARDGQVLGVGGVLVDITERKQQEERLRQTAEFRERFLGVVSHDLRNPLNAILLSANALLRTEGIPASHTKMVRRIVTSGERMGRMIGELLDFTRGRLGGGIPIHPQRVNLRHLSRHVLEELELGFPSRELRLRAEGDFLGEWDSDRLAQLLGNLGKNALDYSPADTPVDFSLLDEGDTLRVEVHNEGAPIPRELLAGIFEPFRRAVEGDAHPTSGLGLGLFIVQEIARAHGGSVEVRSSEGDGTTFSVRLPRHGPRAREDAGAVH